MSNKRQLSFSSGEISPALYARADLIKYNTGLKTCLNYTVMRHGGLANRAGTGFSGEVKDSSKTGRLIPFVFNTAQTYVLEFGDLYVRMHRNGSPILESSEAIAGATQANPCVLTVTGHPYSNGDEVYIKDVVGMTTLNTRNFKVANVTTHTFSLQYMDGTAVDSTAFTAYSTGGTVERVYTVTTPYLEADLAELSHIQSADVVTLTHPSYDPRELSRTADTSWSLDLIDFGVAIATPIGIASDSSGVPNFYKVTAVDLETGEESLPSPRVGSSTETSTLSWDVVAGASHYNIYKELYGVYGWIGTAGDNLDFKDSAIEPDVLDNPPVDRQPFLGLEDAVNITGATKADPCVITTNTNHGYSNGDEVRILSVGGMEELNAINYTIANKTATTFELVGIDSSAYTAFTSGGEGRVAKITRADNRPSTCSYYQQRLMFANTNNNPEGVWGSKTALRNNFNTSTPLEDTDPVTFSLLGRQVNEVHHLLDLGKQLMFTESGEWVIDGDASGVLTPTGINPRQHTANGVASRLAPLVANSSALYVQSRGSVIRDIGYDLNSDGYNGNELTIFSSHLFDNYTLSDWAYQQIPHSIVWTVRDDGALLGLTYVKEHQVFGWHRHAFENGTVENVCVVPEGTESALYLIIKRTIEGKTVRYVEYMKTRQVNEIEDSVFMDSSLSYSGVNTGATTMTLSGGTTWAYDESITLTSSVAYFSSGDVGTGIWITGADGTLIKCTIKAFTSTTIVTVKPNKDVPVDMQNTAFTVWSKAVGVVSGLWHLEGQDVSVLGDGFVSASPNNDAYETVTVANGAVIIDELHTVIHVGLPITADMETLDMETPQGQSFTDKKKHISEINLFVESSRGVWAGNSADDLTEVKQRENESTDDPIALATGTMSVKTQGKWGTGGIFVRQIDPLPLSILAVVPAGYLAK